MFKKKLTMISKSTFFKSIVLYILALITVKITLNWNFKKTFVAFIASLLPFGTFILDKSLKKEEQAFLETRNEVVG
jgi:hypothetical protein